MAQPACGWTRLGDEVGARGLVLSILRERDHNSDGEGDDHTAGPPELPYDLDVHQQEHDATGRFTREELEHMACTYRSQQESSTKATYKHFQKWCNDNGVHDCKITPESVARFMLAMLATIKNNELHSGDQVPTALNTVKGCSISNP